MNAQLILAAIMPCVCMISGCYRDARINPVDNALAPKVPRAVVSMRAGFKSGKMTVTLPNGEKCRGAWRTIDLTGTDWAKLITENGTSTDGTDAGIVVVTGNPGEPAPTRPAQAAANARPPVDLESAWVAAWGQIFYDGRILGARSLANATLTGNRGTVLHVEIYLQAYWSPNGGDETDIMGVARDNKGNIYKVKHTLWY